MNFGNYVTARSTVEINQISITKKGKKMKKLAMFALFVCMSTVGGFAVTQTFTGVVTDSMCARKHMMPGKSEAECVRECVKDGAKYALRVGDKLYTLTGDAKQFQQLAGKKATVSGDVTGTTVAVKSIVPAK